ncbi:hypothetical protein [Oceanobacillus massiliensis]|uniref:hypothetical protein n=1 Tax=Oceanobacillus massiliensis TaxID=1465765 RepID=UPI000289735E|nr:hypothetical protein [Oceanobacillus massiliensis]
MVIIMQVLVFGIISYLTLKAFNLIMPVRKKLSCEVGMMASMMLGAMAGFLAGTVLALNLDYTLNTFLAAVIGIGAGVIIGMPFNQLAILEGIMGGLMGGTMGAMIGEMLLDNSILIMSCFLVILAFISLNLLGKAIKQGAGILKKTEASGSQLKKISLLIACIIAAMIVIVIVGHEFNNQQLNKDPIHIHHHESD